MLTTNKIKSFIIENRLFTRGDRVIIGISGGADSVTLTHILNKLKHEIGIQIILAHFNHNLRESAMTDQRFVEKLAAELNIKLETSTWPKSRQPKRGSIEESARERRLHFFQEVSQRHGAQIIALAHNQNDLAETVLMRILRGSGLKGLRSILPRRKIGDLIVVRPLLDVPRKDIETYLKRNKLGFRTDPTNKEKKFFRNKIRLDLLPYLERHYSPGIINNLSNLSKSTCADYDFIDTLCQKTYHQIAKIGKDHRSVKFNLKSFRKLHLSLQRMLVRESIHQLSGSTNRLTLIHIKEIEDLLDQRPNNAKVNLPHDIEAIKRNSNLLIKAIT